jgi:alkylation response protein AidB-like acyl-CoA dehydrogenase
VHLGYTAEQEALRASVRAVLTDHAPLPALRSRYREPVRGLDAAWPRLVELGVADGLELRDLGPVLEECGRALYDGPVLPTVLIPQLAATGPVALAVLEPGRRYAWDAPATTVSAGRLSGEKVHVFCAGAAETVLVVARDDTGSVGLWSVPRAADGVTVEGEPAYDGSSPASTVRFDAAAAQPFAVGADAVAALLDRMVALTVVAGVGAGERALELALDHARTREQFGRPIGSFQLVQQLCVQMLTALELGRAAAHAALWALDTATPDDAHAAVTLAASWATEALPRLGADAVQVFGGTGFTWEHDVGLYYKRLLTLQHAWGDTPHHLARLPL